MPTTNRPDPFPPVTYAQWRAGVAAEAGGRSLRAITEDGIAIEPLYAPGGPGEREARMLEGRVAGLLPDATTHRMGQPFRATGATFFDAGATTATTLGATMAVALEYLRAMERSAHEEIRLLEEAVGHPKPRENTSHSAATIEAGVDMVRAASSVEVLLPCGPRFFESAAMLRAARLIWARVLEISEIPHSPLTVVASTGRRTLTLQDPWNNALRNTAVAFAAAIGGADELQLLPHDIRAGEPGAAALRLAQTTGMILEEEASLGRVMDSAEGSWFLESLTAEIAAAAWEEMRRIDAEGGIIACVESGALGHRIAEQAAARHARVRDGQHPILGVTDHPVSGEVVSRSQADKAASDPARPLPFRPDAMPVETA